MKENNNISYEKLKEVEERYRILVEDSPDAISIICEWRIAFVNKKCIGMFGHTADELIGKSPVEYVHPEDKERAIKNASAILSGELLPGTREYKIIGKNGEIIEAEVSASKVIFDGKPALQSIFRDITERKKRDKEIKEYIRQLEILNNMAVERELRMIELKKEINKLLGEMGREKRYRVEESQ
jgi:PAS domain S-box-containing protein